MKRIVQASQRGFTIVELLIATMIFSVVLLIVTAGILQISRVYYQGVTEANTQDVARSIIDTISQAIQFDSGDPSVPSAPGSPGYFCIGSQEFVYYPGLQLVDSSPAAGDQTLHGLVVQPFSGGCTAPVTINGRELLSPHMRLSNVSVSSDGPETWKVNVRVVYGDKDLLKSKSAPSNPVGYTASDAVCRGNQAGTQFCAVSDLTTVVVKRVQ